jgi:hypothetical protein
MATVMGGFGVWRHPDHQKLLPCCAQSPTSGGPNPESEPRAFRSGEWGVELETYEAPQERERQRDQGFAP